MSVKTRQDKTASLTERGELSDLFASALVHIRGNKRSETQRTNLRRALQLFNENRLAAVVLGMTESLPANLLELLSTPPEKILPEAISRYVKVRYFGELFLPAVRWSSGKSRRALEEFVVNLGIPLSLDLNQVKWVPPYAQDPEVIRVWNMPMHELSKLSYCSTAHPESFSDISSAEPTTCRSVGEYLRLRANWQYHRWGLRDHKMYEYLKARCMDLPMFVPLSWTPAAGNLEVCKHYGHEDWGGIEVRSWVREAIQEQGFPTIESLAEKTVLELHNVLPAHLIQYARELMEKKGLTPHVGEGSILDANISSLKFSVLTTYVLQDYGVTRIGQLTEMTENEFLRSPFCGRRSLNEVKTVLAGLNLGFKR